MLTDGAVAPVRSPCSHADLLDERLGGRLIADREGAFGWTVPNEEQFRFHLVQTRELGGYLCGRRLYQTMLPRYR